MSETKVRRSSVIQRHRLDRLWTALIGVALMILVTACFLGGTPEWVEAISVFATFCTTGAAAIIGLDIWRSESLGHRKAEVSEHLLEAAHGVGLILKTTRGGPLSKAVLDGSVKITTYGERLDYLSKSDKAFSELSSSSFKASLFFDFPFSIHVDELFSVRSSLISDLRIAIAIQDDPGSGDSDILMQSCRENIVSSGPDDAVSLKIDSTMKVIEDFCYDHIRFNTDG